MKFSRQTHTFLAFGLSILLALTSIGHLARRVQAADPTTYYISVYDPYEDRAVPVEVQLGADGEIFMEAHRLAYFAGYDTSIVGTSSADGSQSLTNGMTIGRNGHEKTVVFNKARGQYGHSYFPLAEAAEKLRFTYEYLSDSDTLVIIPFLADADDLVAECQKLMKDHFQITFLDNTSGKLGVTLSTIYNVVGGVRFDYVTGGYDQEIYAKAITGILDSGKDETLDWVTSVDKLMGKYLKMLKATQTSLSGEKLDAIMYTRDIDEMLEGYDAINKFVPGMKISDFLEIATRLTSAQHAKMINVNAVRYGLNTEKIKDSNLMIATDLLMKYYDENLPSIWAILNDVTLRELQSYSSDLISKAVLGNASTAWVKFSKLAIDTYFKTDKSMGAVEQANACITIQNEAYAQYVRLKYQIQKNGADPQTAMELKYATILYIRACQYAFSSFSFDEDLKSSVEVMTNKCEDAILLLTEYTDSELLKTWHACEPLYKTQVKLSESYPTIVPGESQAEEPTKETTKEPTKTPETKDDQTPPAYNAMSDGSYTVHVKDTDIQKVTDGWRITGEVYGLVAYTDAEVRALAVGKKIAGITIKSIERRDFDGYSYCYINGREPHNGYILMYDSYQKLWYHVLENDILETAYIGRITFRVASDATMTDNFTFMALGGSPNSPVSDPADYYSLAKKIYHSTTHKLVFTFTVKNDWVKAIDWQYQP